MSRARARTSSPCRASDAHRGPLRHPGRDPGRAARRHPPARRRCSARPSSARRARELLDLVEQVRRLVPRRPRRPPRRCSRERRPRHRDPPGPRVLDLLPPGQRHRAGAPRPRAARRAAPSDGGWLAAARAERIDERARSPPASWRGRSRGSPCGRCSPPTRPRRPAARSLTKLRARRRRCSTSPTPTGDPRTRPRGCAEARRPAVADRRAARRPARAARRGPQRRLLPRRARRAAPCRDVLDELADELGRARRRRCPPTPARCASAPGSAATATATRTSRPR